MEALAVLVAVAAGVVGPAVVLAAVVGLGAWLDGALDAPAATDRAPAPVPAARNGVDVGVAVVPTAAFARCAAGVSTGPPEPVG